MISFSLSQMFGAKISFGKSRMWHFFIGIFAGVLGGLSSIWSPPVAMYLLARNVSKAEFIGATGFLFLAGSIPLAIGLAFAGVLTVETVLHSLLGLHRAAQDQVRHHTAQCHLVKIFCLHIGLQLGFQQCRYPLQNCQVPQPCPCWTAQSTSPHNRTQG